MQLPSATHSHIKRSLNWTGALEAGASFTAGTHENWRLPTIKEVASLVSGGATLFNTRVLNGLNKLGTASCRGGLWSSTPVNDSYQINSLFLTNGGGSNGGSRSSAKCVLLVRDLN